MDSQILSLYAKGMTTREIVTTFKEMYDSDVSPTLIMSTIFRELRPRPWTTLCGFLKSVLYRTHAIKFLFYTVVVIILNIFDQIVL